MKNCYDCLGINVCLSLALNNEECSCVNYKNLCSSVNETVDKFNSIGFPYYLPEDVIKELIFQANRRKEKWIKN